MRIPSSINGSIRKREDGSNNTVLVIVAAVVIGLLVLSIAFHFATKTLRVRARGETASQTKRRGLWSRWPWQRGPNRGDYSSSLQQGDELASSSHLRQNSGAGLDPEREMAGSETNRHSTATTTGVGRNTSVRSIMTLPPYSPAVRENERILGREGERGGIDVVVEFPETQGEEEDRREEEMESLYQIRVARRQEAAEREERRRLRREARARNDRGALDEIRLRAGSAADPPSAALIAQHQTKDRQRRVSSVQYAELGVARHDGSRVRANSGESDRRPLLDSAASMAESRGTLSIDGHRRGRSGSSIVSLSSNASDDDLSAQRTISQNSMNDYEVVSLNHSRNPSATRSFEDPNSGSDMGVQPFPTIDPPVYDDLALEEAPPYESPVRTRAPQLPGSQDAPSGSGLPQRRGVEHLPSIRVTNAQPDTAPADSNPRR